MAKRKTQWFRVSVVRGTKHYRLITATVEGDDRQHAIRRFRRHFKIPKRIRVTTAVQVSKPKRGSRKARGFF